jgi:hypothetical protein
LFLDCRNLYETELSLLADPDYMQNHGADHQPKNYIDQSMRMIVISWLVEVACEYELHQETLFLAAALLDRYMSLAKVLFAYMTSLFALGICGFCLRYMRILRCFTKRALLTSQQASLAEGCTCQPRLDAMSS